MRCTFTVKCFTIGSYVLVERSYQALAATVAPRGSQYASSAAAGVGVPTALLEEVENLIVGGGGELDCRSWPHHN